MDTSDQLIARKAKLEQLYVGKDIENIPKPAVVLDVSKARRHCSSMLAATKALGVGFRPHIKTHKTVELTKMQIGDDASDVKLVVSTVAEIEHILPLLKHLKKEGRRINVLYGLPLPASQVDRVAEIACQLGPGSISFMLDHPSQIISLRRFFDAAGFPAEVFMKVDTGYHRAGLPPEALNAGGLVEAVTRLHLGGEAILVGLYSHSSLSYQGKSTREAMDNLSTEIRGCVDAVRYNHQHLPTPAFHLTISVGASPQVTSIQNFVQCDKQKNESADDLMGVIQDLSTEEVSGIKISVELHAGVYSVLDMQQLSTNSRSSMGRFDEEIAISVVAEVVSVYNDGERQNPEALVAVGTLGLGKEPCPSYDGWGIVGSLPALEKVGFERRLVVKRISQEHSILSWDTDDDNLIPHYPQGIPLEVGQAVRIYPNHACITGAMYDWYFVIDSSQSNSPTKVIDIWMRARGW
ncbi:putative serine dehydratase domain-containing protein [Annulohypoxylon truncatum]|uniref:putative serine dehydratase domain-containing protein n=1 Tax=Annulohypoxylon truncatum TaxID=327061 RepID=UPI002007726D|nr:putative serine dehydratase domain-containing protein [Annulohypoxylon truncatum]KAI1204561.1 putative serine dehydratase domain-containing protein [Annulohypoxylon truncatum]